MTADPTFYRDLLKKYMIANNVLQGISFLDDPMFPEEDFTDEEILALRDIDNEIAGEPKI